MHILGVISTLIYFWNNNDVFASPLSLMSIAVS